MTNIMTPSEKTMTIKQIDKAVAQYRAMLEKYAPQFASDPVQQVLGDSELAKEEFSLFRARVEAVSDMITRVIEVDYDLTPDELLTALVATGCNPYVYPAVLAAMPRPAGMTGKHQVPVLLWKPRPTSYRNRLITDAALAEEYIWRNQMTDPWASFTLNTLYSELSDKYPNATHWQDADGNWHYAAFDRWDGERGVDVDQNCGYWAGSWRFSGRSKAASHFALDPLA